jgi:hypothetical protein
MPIREIPKKDGHLLGWRIKDEKTKRWTMPSSSKECIKNKMKTHKGFTNSSDTVKELGGGGNMYIFGFTGGRYKGEVSISLHYNGDAYEVELDAQGIADEEIQENLIDDFVNLVKDMCKVKGVEMMGKSVFYREDEMLGAKSNLYGYAEKDEQDDLLKAFETMNLKKEGGRRKKTRRVKKARATRRRKTDLHNRRR